MILSEKSATLRDHALGSGPRHQTAMAHANARGAATRPRYIQVLYASASLGRMKRWARIQMQATNPNATLMRSPGVSYADQILSLWGALTRIVTMRSAPTNSERSSSAATRK